MKAKWEIQIVFAKVESAIRPACGYCALDSPSKRSPFSRRLYSVSSPVLTYYCNNYLTSLNINELNANTSWISPGAKLKGTSETH